MAVWALGINHTTAPLDLRGRFAFAIDQIAPIQHAVGWRRCDAGAGPRHPAKDLWALPGETHTGPHLVATHVVHDIEPLGNEV